MRGLTAADFTVAVAGQPRRVVSAEFVDSLAETSRSNLRRSSLESMISTNEGASIGRMFVFVVDQGTLEPGNVRHVGQAASRFLSTLSFADRSALMLLPSGPNVTFTWAHDKVREGLGRVIGQAGHDSCVRVRQPDGSPRNLQPEPRRPSHRGAAGVRQRRGGLGRTRRVQRRLRWPGRPVGAVGRRRRRWHARRTGRRRWRDGRRRDGRRRRHPGIVGWLGLGTALGRRRIRQQLHPRPADARRVGVAWSTDDVADEHQLDAPAAGVAGHGPRRQECRADLGRMAARRQGAAHIDHDARQRGGRRTRDLLHPLRAQHDRLGQPADDHVDARQRQLPAFRPARYARQHDRRRVVSCRSRRGRGLRPSRPRAVRLLSHRRREGRHRRRRERAPHEGAGRARRGHRPRPGNLRRAQLRRSRLGGAPRARARSANRLDRHRPARHQLSRRRFRGSQARQAGVHRRGLARRSRAMRPCRS